MKRMWADIFTKEKHLPPDIEDVLMENMIDLPETNIKKVKTVETEIKMENVRNCRTVDN